MKILFELNEGINELFICITQNPGMRSNQLAERNNKPQKTIERWLKTLKNDNKILFKGSKKTGGYYAK